MSAYQEFTGKSVEEALRQAREEFGVGLDELDFEILTPGSRGVLGMGAEPARIVAAPRAALGGAAPKREAAAARPLPARRSMGRAATIDRRAPTTGRRAATIAVRAATSGQIDPRCLARRPRAVTSHDPSRRVPKDPAGMSAVRAATIDRRAGTTAVRAATTGPPRRSGDRPGASPVSSSEADEVQTARSLVREREELQAAEASPEALAAGKDSSSS